MIVKNFTTYEATSGPDIEYSKIHLSEIGKVIYVCGLDSPYFSEKSEELLSFKEEIISTENQSIPLEKVCKRCMNRVKALTSTDIKSSPSSKGVKNLTIDTFISKGMTHQEAVRFYFPDLSSREVQFLLLKHTCYPIYPELMLRQLREIYTGETKILSNLLKTI